MAYFFTLTYLNNSIPMPINTAVTSSPTGKKPGAAGTLDCSMATGEALVAAGVRVAVRVGVGAC